ncbi:PQQ-binding-like beta-propeller repeat protein [Gemmatimonadota bacterium]
MNDPLQSRTPTLFGMAGVLCLALVMTGLSAPQEQPVAMFRGSPSHVGVYDTDGVDHLGGVLWRFRTKGPVRSSPAVAGEMVYVGSTDGSVYALDRASGLQKWRSDVGSPVSSSPAVAHGLVFFGSNDGVFHAVDSRTGTPRWRFDTGILLAWEWGYEGWDIYASSAVVVDNTVVFGSGDGVVYALNALSGTQLWSFRTGGRIRATPAVDDGVVFIGSTDGIAYALDLRSGQEKWRHETEGAGAVSAEMRVDRKSIIASPTVAGQTVYMGSRDGHMYALDQETGGRKWRVAHGGSWAVSSPAVLGQTLYSGTSDGRFVHAVDVATGEEMWRFVGVGYTWSSPCVVGDLVYIGDGAGRLRAVDRETGQERWNFPAGDGVYSSPVVADGVVYFGTEDGSVYALHGGGGYPMRAVFWDEVYQDYSLFQQDVETSAFFGLRGYSILDTEALVAFMEGRIEDRTPSVVVFALDYLPAAVAPEPSDTVLFRRYLDAGGKVVWPGLPPMFWIHDSTGRVTALDRGRPASLLGVDHSDVNFDFYASIPTEKGRSWGLERGWVSAYSVAVSPAIEPLAIDENGRAGAWLREFGGPPGTGYIAIGLDHATWEDLEIILTVAEFGLGTKKE